MNRYLQRLDRIRLLSFALVLALIFTTFSTNAIAAVDQQPKPLTINERLAAIEETYGIAMHEPQSQLFPGALLETMDTKAVESSLTVLETALAMVGPGFMKLLNKAATDERLSSKANGATYITAPNYEGEDVTGFSIGILTSPGSTWSISNDVISVSLGGNVGVDQIIMTLAFSYMEFSGIREPTGSFVGQPYGNYQTVPTGFLSVSSAQNWQNDYCAVFSHLVRNSTQNQLTHNSVLWNKGKIVYDDLVKYVGAGSRATQRAAHNLGIEIPKA